MQELFLQEIREGLETSFIDKNHNSNLSLRSQMIYNDHNTGKKVFCSIKEELENCDSFIMSVAFITMSGLMPLLEIFKELEEKNIKGKILTTNYLNFTEPKALKKLNEFSNIKVKLFDTEKSKTGFHTKGYIFEQNNVYKIIIGSSNLTQSALSINKEWNTKVVGTKTAEFTNSVLEEFNSQWNSEYCLDFEEFFENYELEYKIIEEQRRIANKEKIVSLTKYKLKPNSMQLEFTKNIKKLVENGERRALLVSATGTGKTYAAAFAIRELNPKRILFIVHREQIATQAKNSFEKIFEKNISLGLLSGNSKEMNSDFVFSTMQTMAKDEYLYNYDRNHFDIIIIDEVHRAGASSYNKIMNYFIPKLWMGATASPYRSDGFDIFKLFDNNIAHEITLKDALENDLLCTFHYYGISEFTIEQVEENPIDNQLLVAEPNISYRTISEKYDSNTGFRDFGKVENSSKVNYIIKNLEYYGYSGERVKGLIFCSTVEEASSLSKEFNLRGYRTDFLTGSDSIERRFDIVDKLVNDNHYDNLDYIFTVDIFNEGVDIPEINQIVMLRPTESPTIFIQQLGRGLRKSRDKEYVVIIDFIGNYNNNFMIPMALYGDKTYNKDNIRKYLMQGNRLIPGCSSINFDKISKERIYQSIDNVNFSEINLIKQNYNELKIKLGKIPAIMDFETHGSIDIQLIFDKNTLGSYHAFLSKYEKDYNIAFSPDQELMLKFISTKFANGKRPHELLAIKYMIDDENDIFGSVGNKLTNKYGLTYNSIVENNLINILSGEFETGSGKKIYGSCILLEKDNNKYVISDKFKKMIYDKNFLYQINEIIEYGLFKYEKYYSNNYQSTNFQLYSKYTYYDVCRLLNWDKNEVALNIGGYKYDKYTKTYPVFINYHKEEGIADTIKYEDRFLSNDSLIAISKSGRTVESDDVKISLNSKKLGVDMHLFVRKNKDDKTSKEFYYFGKISPTGEFKEFTMSDTNKTAVEIYYKLDTAIREDLYNYIIELGE